MKANKKKIVAYTFVGLIFLAGLFVFFSTKRVDDVKGNGVASVTLQNNVQRIDYLKTFGWTVKDEPVEIVEVAIPAEFDDVYMGYNELQLSQGFNLEDYKGKRVKRFTYEITNYPTQESDVRVNLLVYNDKVIGGDVSSLKLDGFMHGLKMPIQ